MTVGEIIRNRRIQARLSQPELASMVGTRWQRVSEWERSIQKPSGRYALKLWRVLGGNLEDYF